MPPWHFKHAVVSKKIKESPQKYSKLKNKKNTPIGKITLILLTTIPLFLTQI
jgi:hypothetical protein